MAAETVRCLSRQMKAYISVPYDPKDGGHLQQLK
jgi:hypothetical protein